MSIDALGRTGAPVSEHVWEALEKTMVGAATSQLTGRRLLDVRGPYGWVSRASRCPTKTQATGSS